MNRNAVSVKYKARYGRYALVVVLLAFVFVECAFILKYISNWRASAVGHNSNAAHATVGRNSEAAHTTAGATKQYAVDSAVTRATLDVAERTAGNAGGDAGSAIRKLGARGAADGGAAQINSSAKQFDVEFPVKKPRQPQFNNKVGIDEIDDTRTLELINKDNPIHTGPEQDSIVNAWPSAPVRVKDIGLHKAALDAAAEMIKAARGEGAGEFYVSSGYRSRDEQARLYDDAPDKAFVQPPDRSEHQSGLAVDILALGVAQCDLAASPEGKWLAANAWKYGLILRYSEDKSGVTEISGEPWHYRYVGIPHAWRCHADNLCFEEYIDLLKSEGGYNVIINGFEYAVIYTKSENGIIMLPDADMCDVSGDNTGGYIITAIMQ